MKKDGQCNLVVPTFLEQPALLFWGLFGRRTVVLQYFCCVCVCTCVCVCVCVCVRAQLIVDAAMHSASCRQEVVQMSTQLAGKSARPILSKASLGPHLKRCVVADV